MTRKSIISGVYKEFEIVDGKEVVIGYWARPWIHRRRTWRKLAAVKEREAIKEANTTNWSGKGEDFITLADEYVKAGCPNRRLERRPESFTAPEEERVANIKAYFGRYLPEEIKMPLCVKYKIWRAAKCEKGTGERTVDMDLNTLSNILNYGVAIGRLEFNFIRSGRPRFRRDEDVRRSREVAPESADQIHRIAEFFFDDARSQVNGWMTLFSTMTGCRKSELLRLRADSKNKDEPGFVEGNHLFIRRSKKGVNPYIAIFPELREMLDCFFAWHTEKYPKSPWFFPGRKKEGRKKHIETSSFGHALKAACKSLGFEHITPHGCRAYYVTKRRSDGATDTQIAAEIGDKTVAVVPQSYGGLPANWTGGNKLLWAPKEKLPAWLRWQPVEKKVVKL